MAPRMHRDVPRKTTAVSLAVTEPESKLISKAATVAKLALAEWLRGLALTGEYADPPEPVGVRRYALVFRMTKDQYAALEKRVSERGTNESSFMRALALAEAKRLGVR